MSFSIKLTKSYSASNKAYCFGEIQIGSFKERFESALTYWKRSSYENYWKEALSRLFLDSYIKSCLITSITEPTKSNFISWWPLYREGEIVYVHNNVLMLEKLKRPFDPNNPYVFVPERKNINEDGEKISEWTTTIKEISCFLEGVGEHRISDSIK